jgi:hypothetical protein
MRWGFGRRQILKFAIDHLVTGRAALIWVRTWTGRLLSHRKGPNFHPGACLPHNPKANGWDEKGKSDGIGKEPRRQQQGARHQNHGTMGQGLGRIGKIAERPLQFGQRPRALAADQSGSGYGSQHDDKKRWPKADKTANLDEQGDFSQRNRKKSEKQPHL